MVIDFRQMSESDLPVLAEWLQQPHVAEWWGDPPSLDALRLKYGPRLEDSSRVQPYIAYLDGEPIGYIHSYVVAGSENGWWPDEKDPGARGIDQFLADANRLGQGLGPQMINAFLEQLFEDPTVTKVQTDPSPSNTRAIRCYEKVGFRNVGMVITPDGPEILMVIERADWRFSRAG